jgi:hypothetical protein
MSSHFVCKRPWESTRIADEDADKEANREDNVQAISEDEESNEQIQQQRVQGAAPSLHNGQNARVGLDELLFWSTLQKAGNTHHQVARSEPTNSRYRCN